MNPRDWDELAELDPFWSVFTEPEKKYGNWDAAAFFETGERQIVGVIEHGEYLGYPRERLCALDFGCGLGRLTRALAKRFERAYGVDASGSMVRAARNVNACFTNCEFIVSEESNLSQFQSDEFDMVYCWRVLQNVRDVSVAMAIIQEFVRVLRPKGLLVFESPAKMPRVLVAGRLKGLKALLKLSGVKRSHLYWPLRALGISRGFLYTRLRLWPDISVLCIPQDQVMSLLRRVGAKVLEVQSGQFTTLEDGDKTYWVTK